MRLINKLKCTFSGCDLEYTDYYVEEIYRVLQCSRCGYREVDWGYPGFAVRATNRIVDAINKANSGK